MQILIIIAMLFFASCAQDTVTVVDKTDVELKESYKASDSEIGEYTFVKKGKFAVLTFTKDGKNIEIIYNLKERVAEDKVENKE